MFSLPFRHRRKSETDQRSRRASAQEALSPLARIASTQSSHSTSRARSQSHGGKALSRTFSNSLSKRISFFSNNSSDDLNSLVSSQSDVNNVTQELTRFKTLNHDRFPKEVLQYLKFQGLSAPRIAQESASMRISVSASGENVFLPSLVSLSEEEQQNLELNSPNPINDNNRPSDTQSSTAGSSTDGITDGTTDSSTTGEIVLEEGQPTQRHIDDSIDPISHTFAVIVTLHKPTAITNIKAQLQAVCSIQWPKGLPSDRLVKREEFELGHATWDLTLLNHNFYVPIGEDAVDDEEDEWNWDDVDPGMDESKFLTAQKIPSKKVDLRSFDQVTRGGYSSSKRDQDPFVFGAVNGNSTVTNYPPGYYVFLLPTLFEPSLPETVLTTKAHVSYHLRTIVVQKGKSYNYGEQYVPVIRGPPVTGITTADKPIFVSKVWNDTLSYELSFPKKYVTLGDELPFKIKFIPLEKKVTIKRVKVNVVEKVTYTSKSLEYEYDEHGKDEDETYLQTNGNEKIIPLLEVRTKARNSKAVREEVVDDGAIFDNLLSCCYHSESAEAEKVEIIGPLSIATYLPFIKPHKPAKLYPHTPKQFFQTVVHQENKPQASRELPTRISNQNYNVNLNTKINLTEEGLLPDSLNNRYVNINHKLQICVRISRVDPNDGKTHHYEVIIDTPIFVLNGACVPENIELPAYTDGSAPGYPGPDRLPTWQEAMSPMASPMMLPTHEETLDDISRTSTLNSQALDPVYDTIDGLMNDTSELSLGSRRLSTTKSEMLNSFRRTLSHQHEDLSERGATQPDNSSSGSDIIEGESMPAHPPPYGESVALMSDESDGEDNEETFVNDQSTDLTEQFHRAVYGDYP